MERTRAELLDAAAEGLARHGVHTATMEQIAKACDCTPPTLYAYFKNKQSIVDAVLATVVAESAAILQASPPEGLSLNQRLELLLGAMFGWSDRRAAYLRVAATPLLGGGQQLGSASDRMPMFLASVIAAHPEAAFAEEEVEEAAYVLWGLVHGYGLYRLQHDHAPAAGVTARTIVARFARAMARPAAQSV